MPPAIESTDRRRLLNCHRDVVELIRRSIGDRLKLGVAPWMVWAALVVAILVVTVYLQADHNLEPAARGGSTTQQ